MSDRYFIFGEEAVRLLYDYNGVSDILSSDVEYDLYHWKDDGNPIDLLKAFCGWGNFGSVTKAEYNKLVELKNSRR
jgi:hypothetical protein